MKSNSLRKKILSSLIVFSILILLALWIFQVIFLNSYYEWVKIKDMSKITNKIIENYNSESFEEILDIITYDKGVCIEIIDKETNTYSSNSYSRGCLGNNNNLELLKLKKQFISSNKKNQTYRLTNMKFKNKILLTAIKLDDTHYAFVNVSLEPLDSTIGILSSQLFYVTSGVLILSLFIAYLISNKISQPITKINNAAKKMSKGDYDIVFDTDNGIDEINELALTLNQARDELSKTDELRRELLANVSHDLKTPLTMIKAYSEMVRDLTYDDKEKRDSNLNTIIDETDRLALLVNDILELSKIQSNVGELNIDSFDINKMIVSIINKFDYLKERDNYIFEYKENKNIMVDADKQKIEQVIYNLIGNAINYVGKDKKIIIKLINNDKKIKVEITDHGKGIDKEELNLIWDKYYKVDKKYKRNNVGTGLGLSIVKNILISHNSAYGVMSKKNKGTTFYFELNKSD